MIDKVIKSIADDMNRFLKTKHDITEDKVVPSHVMNADGTVAMQEVDKVVMTLVNIEPERIQSNNTKYVRNQKGNYVKEKPSVNVNLVIMFSAYFSNENYLEGLKFISSIIAYFQSNSGVLTSQNIPSLSENADRLIAELISLDSTNLGNVWSLLGGKYMPSALYRFKAVSIRHDLPTMPTPMIRKA